jgi:cytidyltransferase-like protein
MMHRKEDEEPRPTRIVAISGGFDPITIGHTRYILDAARYGDVVIILNSDSWLVRKKGYAFQPWEQRAEILRAIRGVKDVIMAKDDDGTVCETIRYLYPDIFAKGGDRTRENTPEQYLCRDLGIEVLWGCGGNKVASSQELVNAIR